MAASSAGNIVRVGKRLMGTLPESTHYPPSFWRDASRLSIAILVGRLGVGACSTSSTWRPMPGRGTLVGTGTGISWSSEHRGGGQVLDRFTTEQLWALGWSVKRTEFGVLLSAKGHEIIATTWPVDPFGEQSDSTTERIRAAAGSPVTSASETQPTTAAAKSGQLLIIVTPHAIWNEIPCPRTWGRNGHSIRTNSGCAANGSALACSANTLGHRPAAFAQAYSTRTEGE